MKTKNTRTAYYGHWGVTLYNKGQVVSSYQYPVGIQGPVEGDCNQRKTLKHATAEWIDHGIILHPFITGR